MRLRKHVNKIMSSIATGKAHISGTVRNGLSNPSTLAVEETARSTIVGLSQKLSSATIRAIAGRGGGASSSTDTNNGNDDYDGPILQTQRALQRIGIGKNQEKGSRWQLLEEDEDMVLVLEESEIDQDNENGEMYCVASASDYSQISTNASTSKAGNARQQLFLAEEGRGDSLPSTSYCVSQQQQQRAKLQSQDGINFNQNTMTLQQHDDDLNSSQALPQIVLEGISTLLCNHERLDLLLELVNEQEQRAAAENEFAIRNTSTSTTGFKEIITNACRRKLRRLMWMRRGGMLSNGEGGIEDSIATATSSHTPHHHHFDVKQSKLIKSGDNVISISRKQPSGKIKSMKKRMSLFARKLKPSPTAAAAASRAVQSSSSVIKSDAAVVAISQLNSRKKVIVKTLQKSGKQVGKALKVGFMSMGNSMIPAHYIVPSQFEMPGSSRGTSRWEEEHGYYSANGTPYWREYEMYDQYEYDRRKYDQFYQQYAEQRRREQHA